MNDIPARPKPGSDPSPKSSRKTPSKPGEDQHSAFDLWLDRGLHRLFDEVAQEPVPEELLKLIETDRKT